jgi:hypothetical protein
MPSENAVTSPEPYGSLPILAQLLTELDPKHTSGPSHFREALVELRTFLCNWRALHMSLAALFLAYGEFIYMFHRDHFVRSMVLFGATELNIDVMLPAVLLLGGVYMNFSDEQVAQIDGEIQRETMLIDRVRHIPPAALRRLRKRLIVEINFRERAKVGATAIAVFAFVSGLGVHNLPIGSAEWYKQTPNILLIVAPGCLLFLAGVLLRLTRKYMRLVHVLECAEEYYSR